MQIKNITLSIITSLLIAALVSGCGSSSSSSSGASSSSSTSSSNSSSSSSGTADCNSVSAGNGYCMVWQDEFQGSSVDSSKWSFERNCWGGGNGEAQCYVSDQKNVWVDGEFLHIKAIRENVTGPNMGDDESGYDPNDNSGTGTYSSGRIRSKGKGDWRYGRFEIRAQLPSGQGTWPAIWMLPTDWVYGGWALSGEIDIVESVNLKVGGERQVHGTLHYGADWPNNVHSGEPYLLPDGSNPADGFHEYALEWEKGEIRWYVDGDHFATQTESGWYSEAAPNNPSAPFDQRFHMILNFAVGGDWAGNTNDTGIDESAFPQEMIVDYVRVYECSRDPEEGKGCASTDGSFNDNTGVQAPTPVDTSGDGNEFLLFDGNITSPYEWFTWTADGNIGYSLVNVGGEYGSVAEITYNTNEGIGFFQSGAAADFSAYQTVEFDLRVVADSRSNKSALVFRADCVYPCSSGDYSIEYPGQNNWMHYRIPLSVLTNNGLDLSAIDTPFVISPPSGNEQGVTLQVDNIVYSR